MKKLLILLVAGAALALPAGAFAHSGHHHHHGTHNGFFANHNVDNHSNVLFAKVSGTGTSFGGNTATATGSIVAGNDHQNGHFSVALTTDWSKATTKSFTNDGVTVTFSCAPTTGSVTLTNGSTSTASLTGKTCSWTKDGTTKYGFFGRDTTNGVRAFLKEDGTAVTGAVVTGSEGVHTGVFAAAHISGSKGDCNH